MPNNYDGAFGRMVNCQKLLTIFAKCPVLDIWKGSDYVTVLQYLTITITIKHLIICIIVKYVVTGKF